MKYLKKFNENSKSSLAEIQQICDDHFAYLQDEGFIVYITSPYDGGYDFDLERKPLGSFKWETVKDSFISFIDVLTDDYDIGEISIICLRNTFKLSKDQILSDDPSTFIMRRGSTEDYNYSNALLKIIFKINK